ncbi:MAG: hypothetical protein L0Y66_01250 [Myxococcaceae bacterium]|nr:hypothetical protein [Myxococcaceae bacterium]MCI0671311.1 hypothetical protein [Myxococcaceae bacterium]
MVLVLRLLAVLLVLSTSGLARIVVVGLDGLVACADEGHEEQDACSDCSPMCSDCFCGPLRATPARPLVEPVLVEASGVKVELAPPVRVAEAVPQDIFRPPTA